jgi:hypothetical protein
MATEAKLTVLEERSLSSVLFQYFLARGGEERGG